MTLNCLDCIVIALAWLCLAKFLQIVSHYLAPLPRRQTTVQDDGMDMQLTEQYMQRLTENRLRRDQIVDAYCRGDITADKANALLNELVGIPKPLDKHVVDEIRQVLDGVDGPEKL